MEPAGGPAPVAVQVALVSAVRERIRLAELLQHEQTALAQRRAEHEESGFALLRLESRLSESRRALHGARDEVSEQEQGLAALDDELQAVNEVCARWVARTQETHFDELSERLRALKKRIHERLG